MLKRLTAWVLAGDSRPTPDGDARLRDYEFGGAGSDQGVDG
jgi:hypothetical protein